MRRTILRGLAVLTAISGLTFVVAHAGLTAGCGHGTKADAQNPANPSNATTQAAESEPAAAPSPTPANAPARAKTHKGRYLPATKAAPVFVPDDDDDDSPPPAPQQQSAPLRTKGNR